MPLPENSHREQGPEKIYDCVSTLLMRACDFGDKEFRDHLDTVRVRNECSPFHERVILVDFGNNEFLDHLHTVRVQHECSIPAARNTLGGGALNIGQRIRMIPT